PTIHDLAQAPSEAVMAHWSGLGYYTRARNLHACAKLVVEKYDGQFPVVPHLLEELPGIGRSTAAAISAFAYGTNAAILDGNVKRVFARVFGIDGYPGSNPVEDVMWQRAVALLPQDGIEAYTQGLMDLGATVCTRNSPQCQRCPLSHRCIALAQQRVKELPMRKPKKSLREKIALMPVIVFGNQVLLEQRPNSGIWGGLLSLPELDGMQEIQSLDVIATPSTSISTEQGSEKPSAKLVERIHAFALPFGHVQNVKALARVRHGFTHFHLHIVCYAVTLTSRADYVAEPRYCWLAFDQIAEAALPAPVKQILRQVTAASQSDNV
ncbi:MAG: A/G-specific adenine glycosylase, partial [Burkholderiaceae bacterium]|nr:A/G-specific adenine glycosylase [Burkholderiaceae bacterium]